SPPPRGPSGGWGRMPRGTAPGARRPGQLEYRRRRGAIASIHGESGFRPSPTQYILDPHAIPAGGVVESQGDHERRGRPVEQQVAGEFPPEAPVRTEHVSADEPLPTLAARHLEPPMPAPPGALWSVDLAR